MFNVTRSPFNLTKSNFNSPEVLLELQKIFYKKCYLCEDYVNNPDKEHFVAKSNDRTKEYDWNNLYHVCKRCNSIKKDVIDRKNLQILDCCDNSINVSAAIKCLCSSVYNDDYLVEPQFDDKVTVNTSMLLHHCYNADNANYGISREFLHEQIYKDFARFITYRMIVKDKDSLQSERNGAVEHLKNMSRDSYPFSIFWKWHILSDNLLKVYFPDLQQI
jgi:hypothetical protein